MAVELCFFVEAGAAVCGMDTMYKQKKEAVFFSKYMEVLNKIEDNQFVSEDIRYAMRCRYKAAKANNTGKSLWRKYESELTLILNFAKKFPRVGSLSELPSGSNQLRQMKMPLVQALWIEKHPVEFFLISLLFFFSNLANLTTTIIFQNIEDLDYEYPHAVQAKIKETWWLTINACKYMLCCFVHKNCKDISTGPTELQPGHSRIKARREKRRLFGEQEERSEGSEASWEIW
jgi:hypothetical protein